MGKMFLKQKWVMLMVFHNISLGCFENIWATIAWEQSHLYIITTVYTTYK